MADSSDAQLLLKKRARRRLVGAFAFAGLAAVVLPMVMDEEPKQQVQDIKISIPGQDAAPFNPKALAARPAPALAPVVPPAEAEKIAPKAESVSSQAAPAKPVEPAPAKAVEKKVDKVQEKPAEKVVAKPAEKAPAADAQRAAAILGGKALEASPASSATQHVVLIGAFANAANVRLIQSKMTELGIKTYTEPLDSPQGKKTRVRAGPFPNREAAEKALDKMKRIGVSGVVAAR